MAASALSFMLEALSRCRLPLPAVKRSTCSTSRAEKLYRALCILRLLYVVGTISRVTALARHTAVQDVVEDLRSKGIVMTATASLRGTGDAFQNIDDLAALEPGSSRALTWWYNWGLRTSNETAAFARARGVEFVPMQASAQLHGRTGIL